MGSLEVVLCIVVTIERGMRMSPDQYLLRERAVQFGLWLVLWLRLRLA